MYLTLLKRLIFAIIILTHYISFFRRHFFNSDVCGNRKLYVCEDMDIPTATSDIKSCISEIPDKSDVCEDIGLPNTEYNTKFHAS